MYRDLVKGNKLCYNFNEGKRAEFHQRKISQAGRVVDNVQPSAYELQIPFQNKRNQILEEKYTEIERENRILLEKITNIMHKPEKQQRSQSSNPAALKKTLNSQTRKKQLVQITVENQQILNRIRNRKSNYETRRILKETSKHSELVQRISEYPTAKRGALNKSTQSRYTRQRSGEVGQQSFNESHLNYTHQPSEKLILYKANQTHSGSNFLVEIYFQDNLFKITADDVQTNTTKILEMSQSDGQKVLTTMFNNNINYLASSLTVNERIHIQGLEQFEQIEEQNQNLEHTE